MEKSIYVHSFVLIVEVFYLYTPTKFCNTCTIFTFSPNFCNLLGKLIMFIDTTI